MAKILLRIKASNSAFDVLKLLDFACIFAVFLAFFQVFFIPGLFDANYFGLCPFKFCLSF